MLSYSFKTFSPFHFFFHKYTFIPPSHTQETFSLIIAGPRNAGIIHLINALIIYSTLGCMDTSHH